MDTIDKGRYADTNKAFQRPLKNEIDYLVEDQNGELHSEVIAREILAENKRFDENKPTTQMLGRFQPFHDGHFALFKRCYDKTGQVVIMIRAMENTAKNPFDFKTVKQNIKMNSKDQTLTDRTKKQLFSRPCPNIFKLLLTINTD